MPNIGDVLYVEVPLQPTFPANANTLLTASQSPSPTQLRAFTEPLSDLATGLSLTQASDELYTRVPVATRLDASRFLLIDGTILDSVAPTGSVNTYEGEYTPMTTTSGVERHPVIPANADRFTAPRERHFPFQPGNGPGDIGEMALMQEYVMYEDADGNPVRYRKYAANGVLLDGVGGTRFYGTVETFNARWLPATREWIEDWPDFGATAHLRGMISVLSVGGRFFEVRYSHDPTLGSPWAFTSWRANASVGLTPNGILTINDFGSVINRVGQGTGNRLARLTGFTQWDAFSADDPYNSTVSSEVGNNRLLSGLFPKAIGRFTVSLGVNVTKDSNSINFAAPSATIQTLGGREAVVCDFVNGFDGVPVVLTDIQTQPEITPGLAAPSDIALYSVNGPTFANRITIGAIIDGDAATPFSANGLNLTFGVVVFGRQNT